MAFRIDVSVIIPAYNCAETISYAINSVLIQEGMTFELIVVDDASTDSTLDNIRAVIDPRLRYIRHENNKGAAAARNTGISLARGRYIALLDSDDVWFPGKLTKQCHALHTADDKTMVCVTAHQLNHPRAGCIVYGPNPGHLLRYLANNVCDLSIGTTFFARREVFDRVGMFDERLRRFEDWEWMIRYADLGKTLSLSDNTAVINVGHRVNATTLLLATQQFFEIIDQSRGPRYLTERCRARLFFRLAEAYCVAGNYRQAIGSLRSGLTRWPFPHPGYGLILFDALFSTHFFWTMLRLRNRVGNLSTAIAEAVMPRY